MERTEIIHDPDNLVEIKGLTVQYKSERSIVHALNGVDLVIRRGESLGLVGETGAGKTSTAISLLRLLPSNARILSGEILYDGKSVMDMSEKEIRDNRGNKIAMIFQNPLTSLNPVFTVGEQIAVLLRVHRNMKPKQATEEAGKLLEQVGIAAYRVKDYPGQFSGGMRQRVGIAAAIACHPELLIADEPTTALDVTIQAQILELMAELQKKEKTSLLMITHNLGIISELCQRVAVMYAGRIIEYGTVREVFLHPAHPYTKGLLAALPNLDARQERLNAIPGLIADPQNLPTGCAFHPRCEHCSERCSESCPEMVECGPEHFVACFHEEGHDATK